MVVDGVAVNHQFSKTLEFERDMQQFIASSISPDISFFSLLRSLTELRISELFVQRVLDRFSGMFSSCNRNFKLDQQGYLSWCGECPKCAFVFLMFAAFMPRDRLVEVYGGKNPLADSSLTELYDDILGLTHEKPFDCVGEVAEARVALVMAQERGEWPELDRYSFPTSDYDYRAWHDSAMPEHFLEMLRHYNQDVS